MRTVPSTLTSSTDDQASTGIASGNPIAMTPTLLITMSARPKADIVAAYTTATSSSLATSQRTPTARQPRVVNSSATDSARATSMSATTTAQPRFASASAVA